MNGPTRPPRRGHGLLLAIGVILLTFGFVFFPLNLTIFPLSFPLSLGDRLPGDWWKYLPVPLLALGVWGLVHPSRYLDRIGGVWWLASGLYCLIGIFRLFGLGWASAWPIYVIAAGVAVILQRDFCASAKGEPERNG